jgi:hypothetical protein
MLERFTMLSRAFARHIGATPVEYRKHFAAIAT